MKFIKRIFIGLLLLFTSFLLIIPNLGNFFDKSETPKQSDIIVCLGGGTIERIQKTVELYKQGFSTKKMVLLTGDDQTKKDKDKNIDEMRIQYLKTNNIEEINFFNEKLLKSTLEEILFIKGYLIKNNFNSAIIISDAPHTRRIQYLLNHTKKENESLSFNLVKSDTKWWNKETYYLEKKLKLSYFQKVLSYFICLLNIIFLIN